MPNTVHVSPSGNDASPNTPQQPLLTLKRAHDILRRAGTAEPKRIVLPGSIYSVKCSTLSIELASNKDHYPYINEEHFTG